MLQIFCMFLVASFSLLTKNEELEKPFMSVSIEKTCELLALKLGHLWDFREDRNKNMCLVHSLSRCALCFLSLCLLLHSCRAQGLCWDDGLFLFHHEQFGRKHYGNSPKSQWDTWSSIFTWGWGFQLGWHQQLLGIFYLIQDMHSRSSYPNPSK